MMVFWASGKDLLESITAHSTREEAVLAAFERVWDPLPTFTEQPLGPPQPLSSSTRVDSAASASVEFGRRVPRGGATLM